MFFKSYYVVLPRERWQAGLLYQWHWNGDAFSPLHFHIAYTEIRGIYIYIV